MFTREFTPPSSNTRITVVLNQDGWELRQESEQGVIQRAFYRDWHRVERALRSIGIEEPFAEVQIDGGDHGPH